jgi:hypothetical protein
MNENDACWHIVSVHSSWIDEAKKYQSEYLHRMSNVHEKFSKVRGRHAYNYDQFQYIYIYIYIYNELLRQVKIF